MTVESASKRFGGYRLLTKLGRGGMGEAWRAVREGPAGIQKDVVIKRILRTHSEDPSFRDSFVNEAKLTARLSHGNIAQLFDFGDVEGEWFMALEYVHGRPLFQVIDRAREKGLRALPTPVAVYIAVEMLKGLSHAHTRTDDTGQPLNIVHRDISPDNVMVSYEGEVKLLDFGIAKARLAGRQETQTGLVKGKVRYFSPEQAQGKDLDARSDIWSVGLVLYEMLAGRPAVEGQQHVVLLKLARGEVPRLRVRAPWVPEPLADIVTRALQDTPEARWPSALAFQEALGRYLHSTAPELSPSSVAGTMAWLFDDALASEGKPATVPESVRGLIEAASGPHPAPDEDISLSKRGTVVLHRTPPSPTAAAPGKPGPVLWAALAGAGVVVLVLVGLVLAEGLTRPEPGASPPPLEVGQWAPGVTPLPLKDPEPAIVEVKPEAQAAEEPSPAPPSTEDAGEAEAKPSPVDEALQEQEEKLARLALKVPAAQNIEAAIGLYNERQFIQASDLFERAIHQGGREWMPVMMLGLCKVKLEKFEEGRTLLLEALQGGGKHAPAEMRADAAYALAVSAEALDMRDEAFSRLRQSFKLTGQVDLRLQQVRKEPRLKQLRKTPEYQDFLAWVDNMGTKRSR